MSIIKHVTLQKIVAHDFRYDPRIYIMRGNETYNTCLRPEAGTCESGNEPKRSVKCGEFLD